MANFTTPFVKLTALNQDIQGRNLTPGLKALIEEMIAAKVDGLSDPKVSVHVASPGDSAITVIVNVLPRPGDRWPEDPLPEAEG